MAEGPEGCLYSQFDHLYTGLDMNTGSSLQAIAG